MRARGARSLQGSEQERGAGSNGLGATPQGARIAGTSSIIFSVFNLMIEEGVGQLGCAPQCESGQLGSELPPACADAQMYTCTALHLLLAVCSEGAVAHARLALSFNEGLFPLHTVVLYDRVYKMSNTWYGVHHCRTHSM
jgi:hypothetical protein